MSGGRQILALLLVSAALPARPDGKQRVLIGAAASLRTVLDGIVPALERAVPDARIEVAYGASSTLARQAREGAPIDLLVTADERTLDALGAAGLLQPGSRVELLGNSLVAIAPDGSPLRPQRARDLFAPEVERIALPDDSVPIGHYARQWLRQAGLLDALGDRVVRTEDVRATAAAVDSGAADLAFVYRTDARVLKRSKVIFQVRDGPRIVYPAAVLKGERPALASAVLAALRGAEARAAFEAAGFTFLAK
jgi:molybdate transport system substrate-binding protein